jgi:DNA-directed RNA polymerase subunit omega
MARITVEDCLEEIPNRFSLVLITAERTKQLLKGSDCLLEEDRGNKEIVTALREIAAGKVQVDMSRFDENENLRSIAGPTSRADLPVSMDDLPPEADAPVEVASADVLPPAADDDIDLPPVADELPPAADA